MIVNYNASVVKVYNATSSLVRLEKIYFKNAVAYVLQRCRCRCKFRSRRIGSSNRLFETFATVHM
jgi:hypothetical protein